MASSGISSVAVGTAAKTELEFRTGKSDSVTGARWVRGSGSDTGTLGSENGRRRRASLPTSWYYRAGSKRKLETNTRVGKKSTKTKRRKQKAKRKKVVGPTVPCWRPHTFTDVHVFYVNRRSELGEGHSETRTSPSLNTHTHKKKRKRVLWWWWWWWWWWYAGGPDLEAGRRFCADWRPGVMEVLRVSGVLTCCGVE